MTIIEQIIEIEQVLLQAMLTSDVKVLDDLIADDLIFTDHTGRVVNKSTDIEAHRTGSLNMESIEPSEQVIKIYDKTAIVSVLMQIKGQYLNHPFQGKIRYSRVWINIDNSWKIVAGHSSSVIS
jgi:ketosteroid isomerase-like protein